MRIRSGGAAAAFVAMVGHLAPSAMVKRGTDPRPTMTTWSATTSGLTSTRCARPLVLCWTLSD
jgi:hypothetical protein